MKTNRYIMFAAIGFEMVALVLVAIYLGQYLTDSWAWPKYTQAVFVVLALFLWFISLFYKLKSLSKND